MDRTGPSAPEPHRIRGLEPILARTRSHGMKPHLLAGSRAHSQTGTLEMAILPVAALCLLLYIGVEILAVPCTGRARCCTSILHLATVVAPGRFQR